MGDPETDRKEEVTKTDPELVSLLQDLEEQKPKQELAPPAAPPPPQPAQSVPVEATQTDAVQEAAEIVRNFCDVRDEILRNYRSDRGQAEDAIQRFIGQIQAGIITQAVIDGYVQSLRIKTDVNSNAIRLLDSIARLLSAGKSGNMFISQQGLSPADLQKILNAPQYPDEK